MDIAIDPYIKGEKPFNRHEKDETMVADFNLLASTPRREESRGSAELWMLLKDIGDPKPLVDRSRAHGLVIAKTSLDPREAIVALRELLKTRPQVFRHIIRVIPIDIVVQTEIDKIVEAVQELSNRITQDEVFRVTVEKRRTELRSLQIIEAVAEDINRKVNLTKPDWIILIEVVGRNTGVSVIRPAELMNVAKEKRALP